MTVPPPTCSSDPVPGETVTDDTGVRETHYTFGDNPTAAQRLCLLAHVFSPSAEDFLRRWAVPGPDVVVDLGCGPGHTTRLLRDVLRPRLVVGLDTSEEFLHEAAQDPPPGARFVRADVSRDLLPLAGADLLYCRYLLTHLADPQGALRRWVACARPGGRLLVQETARLSSPVPQLQRYYGLVAELQRHHGQELEVGAVLGDLAAPAVARGARLLHAGRRRLLVPAASMSRLHVLNLRTWRNEPFAARAFDAAELDALDAWLVEAASGRAELPPVEQELGELVLEQG